MPSTRVVGACLQPGNIMLFEGGAAKIGDLGIAKLLTRTAAAKTQIGTPHYMPPEIWRNRCGPKPHRTNSYTPARTLSMLVHVPIP